MCLVTAQLWASGSKLWDESMVLIQSGARLSLVHSEAGCEGAPSEEPSFGDALIFIFATSPMVAPEGLGCALMATCGTINSIHTLQRILGDSPNGVPMQGDRTAREGRWVTSGKEPLL